MLAIITKIDRLKTMESHNELLARVRAAGKDENWLSDRMNVSAETVRAWDDGKQPIPENKRKILDAFFRKQEEIPTLEGESRTPKSAADIIDMT